MCLFDTAHCEGLKRSTSTVSHVLSCDKNNKFNQCSNKPNALIGQGECRSMVGLLGFETPRRVGYQKQNGDAKQDVLVVNNVRSHIFSGIPQFGEISAPLPAAQDWPWWPPHTAIWTPCVPLVASNRGITTWGHPLGLTGAL